MPTYKMAAPNGQTYSVDGPAGASDDDVRTEILRQHPDAGSAPAAPQDSNWFTKAARIAGQEAQSGGQQVLDSVKNAGAKIASGQPLSMGDWAAPPLAVLRAGSAITKGAYDATFGDKPVAPGVPIVGNFTGGDLAQFATPFAEGPASKLIGAAPKVMDSIAGLLNGTRDAAGNVITAGSRAASGADAMRAATGTDFAAQQATASTQAATDASNSARAAALAQRAKTRAAALTSRQADAAAASAPPDLDVGTPAHLSDIGDQVRAPAMAAQSDIETKMNAADDQYRSAMNAVAADRAASGVGVSDSPVAKALVENSESLVSPDPVTRPDVGPQVADSAGGKLHSMLIDTLKPKNIPLTADEAKQAADAGVTVQKAPDGSLYRTVKPDLATVDNFRRYVGKVLNGKVDGYEAINRDEAASMYKGLTDTIQDYTNGASTPVQQNWKAAKQALAPFEQVRAGRGIVGTQPGTDVAAVPASSIPGRIVSGGRDAVQQASAVAGQQPVFNAMRSMVQNNLSGVKGADAIAAKVAPGTKLGEIVNTDPDLSSAVSDYLTKTRTAEASGAQAADLGQRADAATARAKRLSDIADTLQGSSAKAAGTADTYARSMANLEIAAPKDVGNMYSNMLEQAHKDGRISIDQYVAGQRLAANAQQAFALKSTRDKWLLGAGAALGLGGAIPGGLHAAAGLAKSATGIGN